MQITQIRLWAAIAFAALTGSAQNVMAQMATAGQLAVPQSGAATYSIPIQVPTGVAGMELKLSLVYNSQGGNGWLGVGWQLSGLSAITRCPQTIAQDGGVNRIPVRYQNTDRFCLDGQRLVLSGNSAYGANESQYTTELDNYSQITASSVNGVVTSSGPAKFTVRTRAGLTVEYGGTTDSRVFATAPNNASVAVWALNRISDAKGNVLTVVYSSPDAVNGQYYPMQINYPGGGVVQFDWISRGSSLQAYQAGSIVKLTNYLLKIRVQSNYSGVMKSVVEYDLSYAAESPLRLTDIRQCLPSGDCLPATHFDWSPFSIGLANAVNWVASGNYGGWYSSQADSNGDGVADLILYYNDASSWRTFVALGKGDGTFANPVYWASPGNYGGWRFSQGDFNGDGKSDILLFFNDANSWRAYVSLSKGDGTFNDPVYWSSPGNFGGWQSAQCDCNGDGIQDLILHHNDANSWRSIVALGSGDGTFGNPVYWSSPGNFGNWRSSQGDFNGDGVTDLLLYYNDDGVTWRSIVALGKGDGAFGSPVYWSSPGNFGSWKFALGDFNGDGNADMLLYYNDANGWGSYVAMSKGDGTFAAPVSWGASGNYGNWNAAQGDFNGDGVADLLLYYSDSTSLRVVVAAGRADGSFGSPVGWTNYGNFGGWNNAVADFNGDGTTDLLLFANDASSFRSVLAANTLGRLSVDKIATVGLSQIELLYGALPRLGAARYVKDVSVSGRTQFASFPLWVLTGVSILNGVEGVRSTSYSYGNNLVDANISGRGLLGFQWVQTEDSSTGLKSRTTYRQDFPFTGMVSKSTQGFGGSVDNLSQTTYEYGCYDFDQTLGCQVAPGKRYFVYQTKIEETAKDLKGTALPGKRTETVYDCASAPVKCFGNATKVTITTLDPHTAQPTYFKTTESDFYNDEINWRLGKLLRSKVTSTAP